MPRETVEKKILKTGPSKVKNDYSGNYSEYKYQCSGSDDFIYIEYHHEFGNSRVISSAFNSEKFVQ